jgi:hypothetical protein
MLNCFRSSVPQDDLPHECKLPASDDTHAALSSDTADKLAALRGLMEDAKVDY